MATTEIEKLESRWRENPQGLTFAPLAEAYRKNGDPSRALEVLRLGLEQHPDYIPASIVLGRCHLDQSDLPAAESAFTHVLGLDGENVIALKALAEITERLGRLDESERWLHTLLSVDRSNEEARQQLARVEQQRHDSPAAPAEPVSAATDQPAAELAEPSEPAAALAFLDAEPEAAPAASAEPPEEPASRAVDEIRHEAIAWVSPPAAAASTDVAPLVLDDLGAEAHAEAQVAARESARTLDLDFDDSPGFDAPLTPLPGLVGREADQLAAEAAAAQAAPQYEAEPTPAGTTGEFRVEMAEDIVLEVSGGTEYQTPSAAEQLTPRADAEDPYGAAGLLAEAGADRYASAPGGPSGHDLEPTGPAMELSEPVRSEPAWSEPADAPVEIPVPVESAVEVADEPRVEIAPEAPVEAAAEAPAEIDAEPRLEMVAEAPSAVEAEAEPELAGFDEEALIVTETMAALYRQQGHTADALAVYRELRSRRPGDEGLRQKVAELEGELAGPGRAPSRPSVAARDTGGQSVEELFRGLLAARPLASTPAAWPSPAVPPSGAGPGPGAGRAPTTGGDGGVAGAPTRPATDTLSLSAVFGEDAPAAPPATPGVSFDAFFGNSSAPAVARPERSEAKRDDLDQFHTWLQNLKR